MNARHTFAVFASAALIACGSKSDPPPKTVEELAAEKKAVNEANYPTENVGWQTSVTSAPP